MSCDDVLVECVDGRGRVLYRERFRLTAERRRLTIGRALAADFVVDDEYAAALHAAVEITPDGKVLASDLGSANGIVAAGRRHHGVAALALADGALQVGRSHLRVRTAADNLAPETPDQFGPVSLMRHPGWLAAIGAAAGIAETAYESWMPAPRDLANSMVMAVLLTALLVAMWVAVWALLSRVMLGEWRWQRHAAIILCVTALVWVVGMVLDVGTFALSLPSWGGSGWLVGVAAVAVALFLHLIHASGMSGRRAAQIAVLTPLLLFAGSGWVYQRSVARDVNHIGEKFRAYPPGFRLTAAGSLDGFFHAAAGLRNEADRRRDALSADEGDESDGD